MPLPPNMRLIDPATNAVSRETTVDVWRMVPSVNDVRLTGCGRRQSAVAARSQHDWRLSARWPQGESAGTGAGRVRGACADRQAPPHAAAARRPRRFSERVVLLASRRARWPMPCAPAVTPLPDVDPPLSALEQQGKMVFTRACAQCHGGPGQSTTQVPLPLRFHDISSQCPRPVDTVVPARFTFAPCPPRLARNARTYEITLRQRHGSQAHQFGSGPRLAHRLRRRAAAGGRLEQAGRQRPARHRARPRLTSTTTAPTRWSRWSSTTSRSSSARR